MTILDDVSPDRTLRPYSRTPLRDAPGGVDQLSSVACVNARRSEEKGIGGDAAVRGGTWDKLNGDRRESNPTLTRRAANGIAAQAPPCPPVRSISGGHCQSFTDTRLLEERSGEGARCGWGIPVFSGSHPAPLHELNVIRKCESRRLDTCSPDTQRVARRACSINLLEGHDLQLARHGDDQRLFRMEHRGRPSANGSVAHKAILSLFLTSVQSLSLRPTVSRRARVGAEDVGWA